MPSCRSQQYSGPADIQKQRAARGRWNFRAQLWPGSELLPPIGLRMAIESSSGPSAWILREERAPSQHPGLQQAPRRPQEHLNIRAPRKLGQASCPAWWRPPPNGTDEGQSAGSMGTENMVKSGLDLGAQTGPERCNK